MDRVYIDTAIWRDFFEDRKDPHKDLGKIAADFVAIIKNQKIPVVVSSIVIRELLHVYSENQLQIRLESLKIQIINSVPNEDQYFEAHELSVRKNVPFGDAIHAILARDHHAMIITRDKDFRRLQDVCPSLLPEDVAVQP